MKSFLVIVCALLTASACTQLKVAEVDPSTGYFPGADTAPVVLAKPLDLDAHKGLIVVGTSDFLVGQLKNIGYFEEVIAVDELETQIIKANLTNQVPSVRDKIGLNKAARFYKPFLWLRVGDRQEGAKEYVQFILTDPITLEDYFVTETELDYLWKGVNDQSNWYPMCNSLIDYIKHNSRTYGKRQ